MRKIPTLFVRTTGGRGKHFVTPEVTPGCEWVLNGEGYATEKLDGTNVRLTVRKGLVVRVEKRRNPNKHQKYEFGIIQPWYVDASRDEPADQWIWKAVDGTDVSRWEMGEHCCEAMGPHINGNPHRLDVWVCFPFNLHGAQLKAIDASWYDADPAVCFEILKTATGMYLSKYNDVRVEGFVFHHPDGRRAKIKRKDFERAAAL